MKLIKIYLPIMMSFILSACSQDEPAMDSNYARTLTVSVIDCGFQTESRSVENGYTTQFTSGDKCGLYIVRNGTIVVDNLKITASVTEDGKLEWVTDYSDGIKGGLDGEYYFLYYPYAEDTTEKVNALATSVNDFFADLIDGWTPNKNQSDYATGYSASDLMVGAGTLNDNRLSFSMKHCMGLIIIQVPTLTYVFTDSSIPNFKTRSIVDFSYCDLTPYRMSDGSYRLIWNHRQGAPTITGRYLNGRKEFTVSPGNLRPGCCAVMTIRDNSEQGTIIEYSLSAGDYFCKNSDNNWYIIPQEATPDGNVIGIVFHAGQHENDKSDYSESGIGQEKCHGYAVALKDATNGYCMWGIYETELGCCPTDANGNNQNNLNNPDIDWSGYGWTQKIITAAGGKDKLNATAEAGYPATWFAVVSYETDCNAPSNSSGWFLPSIGQMWTIYRNRSSLFGPVSGAEDLKSNWYWSSSEYYYYPAYDALYVSVRSGSVNGFFKNNVDLYVRPVLAF